MAVMEPYRFQVQVEPGYLPEQSAPSRGRYTFSYTITIRNTGEVAATGTSKTPTAAPKPWTVWAWWGTSRCCSQASLLNTPVVRSCTRRTA